MFLFLNGRLQNIFLNFKFGINVMLVRKGNRLFSLVFIGIICACSTMESPGPVIPDFVNCSIFPDARQSLYVLPFATGKSFRVSRTFDHYTSLNGGVGLYAVDIPMPVGTPVHCMRAGVVVAVEERFPDEDHADFHENWIFIRHKDSTIARYFHLTRNGALVNSGDTVVQGQHVGLSGNSGPSTAPHLHIDVQTCGPNLPPGYNKLPCGMTLPLSFRNTEAHTCGLEPKKSYTAQSFIPDSR